GSPRDLRREKRSRSPGEAPMTSVTLVRRIKARPTIVFQALATAEGIASWWGPDDLPVISAEADVRVGGLFRVRFRTIDDLEHECSGQFLDVCRPERVIMSWRWSSGGEPEEAGRCSRVEFRLREVEGETELTLVHALLNNETSVRSHESGWSGALEKLTRNFAG